MSFSAKTILMDPDKTEETDVLMPVDCRLKPHLESTRKVQQPAVAEQEPKTALPTRGSDLSAVASLGNSKELVQQLNGLRLSLSFAREQLRYSEVSSLGRAVALLHEHGTDLGQFLSNDAKGKLLPRFLQQLAAELDRERETLEQEFLEMTRRLDSMRQLIASAEIPCGNGQCDCEGKSSISCCPRAHENRR